MDTAYLNLLIGSTDPSGTRAYFAYKSIGSPTTTSFDKVIVYDYALKRFSPPIAVTGEYLFPVVKPGFTLDGLDSFSTNLDTLGFTLDSVQAGLGSKLSGVDTTHKLGFFDGANVEATLDIPEQGIEGRRMHIKGFWPRTDAENVYGSVRHRIQPNDALTTSTEALIDARGFCQQRVDTKLARGRIRIPASEVWTYAMGLEPDAKQTGKR